MSPQTAILKFRTRLNKVHSSDYDNIPDWAAVEVINKAAIEVTRNIIHGSNRQQEGDEETRFRIDDIQFLLKPATLKAPDSRNDYFEVKLPTDYLWYKRIIPFASKGECKKQPLLTHLEEEGNVPDLLMDWANQPSWEWRYTFHTILSNKLRIYKEKGFYIDHVDVVYYRRPIKMDIIGYTHEDGQDSTNTDLEFKIDLAEAIIDYAVSITAGDIESTNQFQINQSRSEKNI